MCSSSVTKQKYNREMGELQLLVCVPPNFSFRPQNNAEKCFKAKTANLDF